MKDLLLIGTVLAVGLFFLHRTGQATAVAAGTTAAKSGITGVSSAAASQFINDATTQLFTGLDSLLAGSPTN